MGIIIMDMLLLIPCIIIGKIVRSFFLIIAKINGFVVYSILGIREIPKPIE